MQGGMGQVMLVPSGGGGEGGDVQPGQTPCPRPVPQDLWGKSCTASRPQQWGSSNAPGRGSPFLGGASPGPLLPQLCLFKEAFSAQLGLWAGVSTAGLAQQDWHNSTVNLQQLPALAPAPPQSLQ